MPLCRPTSPAIGLLLTTLLFSAASLASTDKEYRIKAAILFNFTKFTQWPSASFTDEQQPIQLCVLEPNPFNGFLTQLARNKKVGKQQRGVEVKFLHASNTDLIKQCHALFISDKNDIPQHLATHTLAVSENRPVEHQGLHINMGLEKKRIRLEINLDNLAASDIKISSQLLKLAKRTHGSLKN